MQDNYGEYELFGCYRVYKSGLVINNDTDRMITYKSNSKNPKRLLMVKGYGSVELGKVVAWLFLLNKEPDTDYDDLEIEYKDGDMTNCALDNIEISQTVGRPSKFLYLVKKGSTNYTEFKRADLPKHLGKSVSWVDSHINSDEHFLWNNGLYAITDDIFTTWEYM